MHGHMKLKFVLGLGILCSILMVDSNLCKERRIELTRRRRRYIQLAGDVKDKVGYCKLKKGTVDRTM
jgi:hypothetical protein